MKKSPSPVIALWILITVTMVIFIGISLTEDFDIGGYTVTKARFPETLLSAEEQADSIIKSDSEVPDSLTVSQEIIIEPDTTVHNILIFGDSMTHNLAMAIAKYGTKNHYTVTSVTWESSSIKGWRHSGKIKEYLSQSHPDYIIISLGSNEIGLKNFDARIPDVKSIIEQIGDIPYVWVGPPLWTEDKGLYPMLEKTLGKEEVFKIENFSIQRGPDKVHPTHKGAAEWADTLMRWISKSPHPILTEKPDSGTSTKGHKFIYLHPND